MIVRHGLVLKEAGEGISWPQVLWVSWSRDTVAGTTRVSAHLPRYDASHLDTPIFSVLQSFTLGNAVYLGSTLKETEKKKSLALKENVFLFFSFYLFSSKMSFYASRSTGELVCQAKRRWKKCLNCCGLTAKWVKSLQPLVNGNESKGFQLVYSVYRGSLDWERLPPQPHFQTAIHFPPLRSILTESIVQSSQDISHPNTNTL